MLINQEQPIRGLLLEELDNLIKYQPESVTIQAATNYLKNGINMLDNARNIVKETTTKLPKVKVAFSGLIIRKDIKKFNKNITETNKRLRIIVTKMIFY